ncbi:MAG: hypothetical protein ACE5HT_07615 [Gemmatimonadales bacterium]
MELPVPFEGRLHAELRDRYARLCLRFGARKVIQPGPALVVAFSEVTKEMRAAGGEDVFAECLQYAGDTYEYIVTRWQDPRWRVILAIALEMGLQQEDMALSEGPAVIPQQHRAEAFFFQDMALASAAE